MERAPTLTDNSGDSQTYDTIRMYDIPIDSIVSSELSKISTSITKKEVKDIEITETGELVIKNKEKETPKRPTKDVEHDTPDVESSKAASKKPRKL